MGKKHYLFWFEHKLLAPDGEGDVRHGFNFFAVHRRFSHRARNMVT
jgi:hypothetical protein